MGGRPSLTAHYVLVTAQLLSGCGWINRQLLDLDAGLELIGDAGDDEPAQIDAEVVDPDFVDASVIPDSGVDAAAVDDAGPDALVEAGPQPCDFAGTWVSKVTIETHWSATTAIASGSGTAAMWMKYDMRSDGSLVPGSMVSCGVTIPDFRLIAALGGERYGVDFDIPLFDEVPPKTFSSQPSVTIDGAGFPGDPMAMSQLVQVLGTTLTDPLSDAWPSAPASLANNDMDGDGKPGVTVANLSDATHVYMRVDALGTVRADQGYYASRLVMSWTGSVVSCTETTGAADVPRFDTHFVGCRLVGGGECSATQRNTLDSFRPIHIADSATVRAFKVDGASCAVARSTSF